MTRIAASRATENFAETLNRVARTGERVLIHRRGKALAAVVPPSDFALLEKLAPNGKGRGGRRRRISDAEAARKALAEPGESIPFEKVRRELGLA